MRWTAKGRGVGKSAKAGSGYSKCGYRPREVYDIVGNPHAQDIRKIMRSLPKRSRGTDDQYYDTTYPILLKAGRQLRRDVGNQQAAAILALGLTGWNQGAKHKDIASRFIKATASNGLAGLIRILRKIEASQRGVHHMHDMVVHVLDKTRHILNVKNGVSIASKLLHFLSPAYLPIMDRNVNAGLGKQASPVKRDYVDFTVSLWHLGCAGKRASQRQGYVRRDRQTKAPQQ